MKQLVLFALLFTGIGLHATIWQVGPTRSYLVPSAVSNLVADGDTVDIDAGLYTGNVTKWFANRLLLRGVGNGYAHLEAGGNYAEGKAIWVIKGADCVVVGIEFSGCQVPDHNGAGIRQEGKSLTLRNCYFHHNEMGILTSNDGVSNFLFESCEFASNGYGDGYSHNIYVGSVNSLTMLYCYSHDAHTGHLVKSRARFNHLYFNRFTGETGDGSYEVDLPNGGQAVLIGNLIEQCPGSQNGGIISFGLENNNHPEQQLVLSHNTVVNDRFDGRFVQYSNATTLLKMVNNLFAGPGTLLQGGVTTNLDTSHNLRLLNIASAWFSDPAQFDYRPQASSPCIDAGIFPGNFDTIALSANYAYLHPLSRTSRWYSGTAPDIGAYEFLTVPYRWLEAGLHRHTFTAYPNPLGTQAVLNLDMDAVLTEQTSAVLFNELGQQVQKMALAKGQDHFQVQWSDIPPGAYYLVIAGWGAGQWILVE